MCKWQGSMSSHLQACLCMYSMMPPPLRQLLIPCPPCAQHTQAGPYVHSKQHMFGSHMHCSTVAIPGPLMQDKPQSTAASALAAAKAAVSSAGHGQVAVTETRRFAGKDIQVMQLVRLCCPVLPCPALAVSYQSPAEASLHDSEETYLREAPVRKERHGASQIQ